jgi:hypothetical protein
MVLAMNFRRDVLNAGYINGRSIKILQMLLTRPGILTEYARSAMLTAPVDGLTGIIVPYENRTNRPPNENRTLRIPRGL